MGMYMSNGSSVNFPPDEVSVNPMVGVDFKAEYRGTRHNCHVPRIALLDAFHGQSAIDVELRRLFDENIERIHAVAADRLISGGLNPLISAAELTGEAENYVSWLR